MKNASNMEDLEKNRQDLLDHGFNVINNIYSKEEINNIIYQIYNMCTEEINLIKS